MPGLQSRPHVRQAYDIDSKIDDGLANSGNVRTAYINEYIYDVPNTNPLTAPACSQSASGAYNLALSSNAINCALSFKMQGGA